MNPDVISLSWSSIKEIMQAQESYDRVLTADFTALSAIDTCPFWGLTRYIFHKTIKRGGRSMALEAGSASHEYYAALRLMNVLKDTNDEALVHYHGQRLFEKDIFGQPVEHRWSQMWDEFVEGSKEDFDRATKNLCLTALYTSGFYDDERDRRRTMANIEDSCLNYHNYWNWTRYPVWVQEGTQSNRHIGIEIPVVMRVRSTALEAKGVALFYTGKMDGLHWHKNKTQLRPHENKTASRLDDSWLGGLEMSHQVTGYWLAAQLFAEALEIQAEFPGAVVYGMRIPTTSDLNNSYRREPIERNNGYADRWMRWLLHNIEIILKYVDDYEQLPRIAPRFTHSCNRYFSSCAFLSFCEMPVEIQMDVWNEHEEFSDDEWSPLR